MKGSVLTTRTWLLLIAATLLLAAGLLNFVQRLNHRPPPTDGVEWTQTEQSVVARTVAPDSSAARARLAPGDRLIALSFDDVNYQQIADVTSVQSDIETAGVGSDLHYLIERPSNPEGARFYYVDLYKLDPISSLNGRDLYINLIGVVYLFVGFFVLFKQGGRAPYALHFATLCLAAFVFHFYKPIGAYEDLDAAIAFLDDGAFILFAPIFLHFCATYPTRRHLIETSDWRRGLVALLYLPAVPLLAFSTLLLKPISDLLTRLSPALANFPSAETISEFYRVSFLYFIVALVAGASLLIYRFVTSKGAIVRQQLKWVVWGSTLAILPFTLFYAVGYLFGGGGSGAVAGGRDWWTDIAVVPLILIPLTFGNSVVRYRLMDVDVVVRRAAVYALTTLAISAMIGAVVLFVGYYVLVSNNGATLTEVAALPLVTAVLMMTGIVMTAAPLKNFLQERTNRLFYGETYDLRRGLLDFGRTLSATTALEPLLDALVGRLQQVLGVERIAIFIEDERSPTGYRVARVAGLSHTLMVPPDFREMIRTRSARTGIVRADDLELAPEVSVNKTLSDSNAHGITTQTYVPPGFVRRALHYYVPCVVRGRMVAVIGLGRSAEGALLSSEDLEILRTVSGYVAVAIENSLLYQEQRERAAELELLKEFNESIVESINVGLLAVDLQGRVTRCNTALEEMLGIARDEATGRRVEDLFADDFAETLRQILGSSGWQLSDLRPVYKLHTATRDGRPLVLNIAVAPLKANHIERGNALARFDRSERGESKEFVDDTSLQTGALVVLEDVSERTQLEEQLQQREKLSSIGLLASGVAHEINTPLTGVSSYTQMLLGMIPDTDPKHALLQKVRRQTDRAAGIVSNLLNFSRTGGATEFSECNINRVLDDTVQLLEPQLRNNQIEIVRDYDMELHAVLGNPGKLQQVFTNLILNARDAIIGSGRIALRTCTRDEAVIIEVEDNGTGIAPDVMARIYDPFFTTKGVGRGTGLGLAVSYGIVQEHSGHISVESTHEGDGRGTTFRIMLPAAYASRRPQLQATGD